LDGKRPAAEKYFIPFSYGPRACVGRNVAMMELLKVLSNLLKRYHFELMDPKHETVLREGFLLKPTALWVRMTRREQH
jgi:benzoate 4-monooxygenase